VKLAQVTGTVVSTVSHRVFDGRRLLVCELEDGSGYMIAVDTVGSGPGERVLLLDEGTGARQILGVDAGPIRTLVVGVVDDVHEP
jgi:microcompartment protein CcmK/EutM